MLELLVDARPILNQGELVEGVAIPGFAEGLVFGLDRKSPSSGFGRFRRNNHLHLARLALLGLDRRRGRSGRGGGLGGTGSKVYASGGGGSLLVLFGLDLGPSRSNGSLEIGKHLVVRLKSRRFTETHRGRLLLIVALPDNLDTGRDGLGVAFTTFRGFGIGHGRRVAEQVGGRRRSPGFGRDDEGLV